MMKNSPEQIYGGGVETEWLEEQYEFDLKQFQLEPDDTVIMINPNTQNSSTPTYFIWDKKQSAFIAGPDNLPLEWKPDKQLYMTNRQEQLRLEKQAEIDKKKKRKRSTAPRMRQRRNR